MCGWHLCANRPEDFVVQEISAADNIVAFSADIERIPTSAERDAVVHRKLEEQAKKAQKNEKLVFDEPLNGWLQALSETIGEAKARNVETIAQETLDECFIEAPVGFKDRVFVQVCIQVRRRAFIACRIVNLPHIDVLLCRTAILDWTARCASRKTQRALLRSTFYWTPCTRNSEWGACLRPTAFCCSTIYAKAQRMKMHQKVLHYVVPCWLVLQHINWCWVGLTCLLTLQAWSSSTRTRKTLARYCIG